MFNTGKEQGCVWRKQKLDKGQIEAIYGVLMETLKRFQRASGLLGAHFKKCSSTVSITIISTSQLRLIHFSTGKTHVQIVGKHHECSWWNRYLELQQDLSQKETAGPEGGKLRNLLIARSVIFNLWAMAHWHATNGLQVSRECLGKNHILVRPLAAQSEPALCQL